MRGKIVIDKDRCKGCEYCQMYCPKDCIEMSREINVHGVHFAQCAKPDECIACSMCARMCPDVCIEVYERKGSPLYQRMEDTLSKLFDSGLDKIKGSQSNEGPKKKKD